MLFEILMALSTGALGIFLGAQIAEGALLVPYWKALPPKDFFDLHQRYGKKIYLFFAPLTIIATLLPLSTLTYGVLMNISIQVPMMLMGIFTLLFFSTYYLFFKRANQAFAMASISHEELPAAITKWGNWHWTRIFFEFLAFVCSIISLVYL
ncbi:MAG: hypothetical protein AB8G15_09860 [Saprospiraceae bacterium]